ncbi:TetR/AcrR family transcriptional regulator [Edaphobacter paludis]|uniref:TetR/AcrR family transcriptional regulator n=1 Tax=Edaphobacter paludis TaxID=3035702 RepID=A0AAU7CWQ1_9BACT
MQRAVVDRKQKIVAEFRRSEILAAATKVFGNKGFEATRMEEIAKAARLAKGTLYLYFDSKDAIYLATVRQALSELATLTEGQVRKEPTLAGKVAAFIRVRVAFWDEQQSFYRVILSLSREGQHRKRSIAWQRETVLYLQAIFDEGAKAGEIPEQDFVGAAWAMMDAIRGTSERRIYTEGRSTEDDTRFLTEFLLRALQIKVPVGQQKAPAEAGAMRPPTISN